MRASFRSAFVFVFLSFVFAPLHVAAQSPQAASSSSEATKLPVRRVVLYKNGVGYFEHLGRVRGNQEVTIEFTSGQLNDVLKSLTTLDLSGGRITGVNYNSDAPLSRRLGALRLPLDQQTTLPQFLNALRGAELQVRSGTGSFTGRLLSVERRQRTDKNGQTTAVDELSLVTGAGEMRIIELGPDVTVRLAERDLASEVGRYLDLVSSTRERDLRRMTISTAGTGERQLYVSYISEVPIWKTTYRVVLPSKPATAGGAAAKPLLQGWAIVDNTVGEDWKDVELSLVAGAPQSFIQQLSQPYYSRRPVVPLPESVMLEPQTHQATLIGGDDKVAGLSEIESMGLASKVDRFTRSDNTRLPGSVAKLAPPPAARPSEVMARMEASAQGQELGDLFEYKMKEPVTIAKNQSAMVPIVHTDIAAEKVSLWNEARGTPRPLRALWLTNSSNLTLDGGSFSVLEEETFAGEGLTDALKPGEKRLLSYAVDLGVTVDTKRESQRERVTRVRILRGVMLHTSEERATRTYTIRNEDTTPRALVIEHPVQAEWKLAADAPKPGETTPDYYRFRAAVEPKKTATLAVTEFRPLETRYELTSLDDNQIAFFLRTKSINERVEAELRKIIAQRSIVAGFDAEIRGRQSQVQRIFDDQQRVRENMKALKGSAEEKQLLQRYTRQLDQQENQLDTLRAEITQLQIKHDAAQAELNRMAQEITLDVTL